VLKTLDLSKTSPLIVQFEHNLLAPQELSGAIDYLNSHGYRVLYGGHQIDTLALHNSLPFIRRSLVAFQVFPTTCPDCGCKSSLASHTARPAPVRTCARAAVNIRPILKP
jgi:hypothetical protein